MKIRDFQSDDEVHRLVAAFEAGAVSPGEFKHSAHLAVGLAYLASSPVAAATERMRGALRRFLRHHGVGDAAYHETLTVFWMKLLHHLATARYAALPLWQRVNAAIASHGAKWPVEAHYSSATLASPAARQSWVEPDLLGLPF